MKQGAVCLLLILIIGCSSPTIQSTNLIGLDIPDYVDQRVYESIPDEATSIIYMKTLRLPRAGESVSVCFEATTDDTIYYGLVTRVGSDWFATVPSVNRIRSECPVFKGT